MSNHNRISGVALRTARWSAEHPWRAILAWCALVAASVGLAIAVPTVSTTDADYRVGESGRAAAMVADAGMESPSVENVLITSVDGQALQGQAAEAAATELVDRLAEADGVADVDAPVWNPDRSALLLSIQLARDQTDVSAIQQLTRSAQERHPDLVIQQTGRRVPRRRDRRAGGRRPVGGRGDQPPRDADPDAGGVRCAHRGGHPGPAGGDQRRGDHRRHGSLVPPRARRGHGEQHDRADRDGGRGRLLAVLPQARARGAGQGRDDPRCRGDRGGHLRPLDHRLRAGRRHRDDRPLRHRVGDLQLTGHRRDRRRRGGGARLDHGAAGPARDVRPLGRPAPGPSPLAGERADRPRRAEPSRPGARRTPPRLVAAALRGRRGPGLRARPGHEDPLGQPRDAARVDPGGADLPHAGPRVPAAGRRRPPSWPPGHAPRSARPWPTCGPARDPTTTSWARTRPRSRPPPTAGPAPSRWPCRTRGPTPGSTPRSGC